MEKKYVVKDFLTNEYYCGINVWDKDPYISEFFDDIEEAEKFISFKEGFFLIETIYTY